MRGIDEAVFNVSVDSRSEKCGFLIYKAYLQSKPLQVQIANINTIQAHRARVEIIEPLNKGDHGDFPDPEAPTSAIVFPAENVRLRLRNYIFAL